jgi:hypothetical protein
MGLPLGVTNKKRRPHTAPGCKKQQCAGGDAFVRVLAAFARRWAMQPLQTCEGLNLSMQGLCQLGKVVFAIESRAFGAMIKGAVA